MPSENDDLENLSFGPGAVKERSFETPMLDGMDQNYYVEILNPLPKTFIGRVASSRPGSTELKIRVAKETPTITRTSADMARNYGIDLEREIPAGGHKSQQHFSQTLEIPSGQTVRLPGNEAQVVIRQLVNVIMDVRGLQISKGDAYQRSLIEHEIVIRTGTMDEFFTTQNINMREMLNKDMNHAIEEEQPFPDAVNDSGNHRGPGRPRKGTTESSPAPGTGTNYQKTAA